MRRFRGSRLDNPLCRAVRDHASRRRQCPALCGEPAVSRAPGSPEVASYGAQRHRDGWLRLDGAAGISAAQYSPGGFPSPLADPAGRRAGPSSGWGRRRHSSSSPHHDICRCSLACWGVPERQPTWSPTRISRRSPSNMVPASCPLIATSPVSKASRCFVRVIDGHWRASSTDAKISASARGLRARSGTRQSGAG